MLPINPFPQNLSSRRRTTKLAFKVGRRRNIAFNLGEEKKLAFEVGRKKWSCLWKRTTYNGGWGKE